MNCTNVPQRFAWCFAMFCIVNVCCASAIFADTVNWVRQLGTPTIDESRGVSADGRGNVYMAGFSDGPLGSTKNGARHAFVSKYDDGGDLLWVQQVTSTVTNTGWSVSADRRGAVYVSGSTVGSLGGQFAGGSSDAFVTKFDAAGNLLWNRQLGSLGTDESHGVSADGLGNVYIAGDTDGSLAKPGTDYPDAFLARYDESGNLLWTRQFGTNFDIDHALGVAADGLGSVFVAGWTTAQLYDTHVGSSDGFISKFDAAGNLVWGHQFGTVGQDFAEGVAADGFGNVYVTGWSGYGNGNGQVFLLKYDAAGNLLWTQQLGTSEFGFSVSADGLGNVFITGGTDGNLAGTNAGSSDVFVARYNGAGDLLATLQLGTTEDDEGHGVSADGLGNAYVSGFTTGNLGGPNAGHEQFPFDAFVLKVSVPEPSSVTLATMAVLSALLHRNRHSKGSARTFLRCEC